MIIGITMLKIVLMTLALTSLHGELQAAKQTQRPKQTQKTQTGNQKGCSDLCSASKKFFETYQTSCVSNSNQGSKQTAESTLHTLCAVVLCPTNQTCPSKSKRFLSADDIPESDQTETIARKRSLNGVEQDDLCSLGTDHIETVLNHLHRVLDYYNTLTDLEVSSTLLAARTIQAQIALILENPEFGLGQFGKLEKLRFLQDYSRTIAMHLEETNGDHWIWIDRMMSSTFFWKMPRGQNAWKDWNIMASKEVHPVSEFQNLTEYRTNHLENNACYLQMVKDCGLTQECADLLMDDSAILTTLDHNIRFFQIAKSMECVTEVDFTNKFRSSNWEDVMEAQCAKMWNEANIISNADFPTGYKGLFLVHAASCGFVGYPNFLRVYWINRIMSWMDLTQNGCIPPDTKSERGDDADEYDAIADNGEWCALWETALAVQVLITHLRYLHETCIRGGNGN